MSRVSGRLIVLILGSGGFKIDVIRNYSSPLFYTIRDQFRLLSDCHSGGLDDEATIVTNMVEAALLHKVLPFPQPLLFFSRRFALPESFHGHVHSAERGFGSCYAPKPVPLLLECEDVPNIRFDRVVGVVRREELRVHENSNLSLHQFACRRCVCAEQS